MRAEVKPCGPSPEQTQDAAMRGEAMGTWERCGECERCKAEERLLASGALLPRKHS